MGYRLYWSKGSGAFPAAVVLDAAKQPFDSVELTLNKNEQHRAEYLAINPMGQVPALQLPDGQIMTESAAIAWYLADRHPEAKLLPPRDDARRATLLRWQVFGAAALYEDDLRFYYPDRYTDDPEGAAAVKSAALARMDRLAAIAADLVGAGPWALGDRFSAVDLYLTMLLLWHPDPAALQARHPNLATLIAGVRARPAVARIWAENYGG